MLNKIGRSNDRRSNPICYYIHTISHQHGANPLNQNPASQDLGPDPIIVPQVLLFLKVVNQGAGGRGGTCYLVPAAIKAARLGICD